MTTRISKKKYRTGNYTNKAALSVAMLLIMLNGLTACGIFKRSSSHRQSAKNTVVSTKHTDTLKQMIATKPPDSAKNTAANDKKQLLAKLKPLLKKQLNFSTFSAKVKMHYQSNKDRQEFTANFRIRKDSAIWVAVTALGGMVQAARVFITPDSFYLINYLQKEVYIMPLKEAAKLIPTPVDFSSLQNLIIGNILKDGGDITDAIISGDSTYIKTGDTSYIQQVVYNNTDSTLRSSQLNTLDPNGPQGIIQYLNYDSTEGKKFSTLRLLTFANAGDQYYVDMNFVKYVFDEPIDIPFTIPKNYTLK